MSKRDDVTLLVKDGRIRAITPRIDLEERFQQIPAYYRGKKEWSWPATPHVAGRMVEVLQGLQVGFDNLWLELYEQFVTEKEALEHRFDRNPPQPRSRTTSWLHQRQAHAYLSRVNSAGLFADMGTGKTKIAIDLIVERGVKRTLVVGPRKTFDGWEREIGVHAAAPITVIKLDGMIKERCERVRERYEGQAVWIVNYEALAYETFARAVDKEQWDMVILDEAHRIKAPTGKVSQFMAKLAGKVQYKLALTGTPAGDKPLDVYGLYRFIDPGIFGLSFGKFKEHYAIVQPSVTASGQRYDQILGYQNQEELAQRMYSAAFRVGNDVLKLLEPVHVRVGVDLEKDAMRTYRKLANESALMLEQGDLVAPNVITRFLRLQQLTSGWVPITEGEEEGKLVPISEAKRDALADLLEDISPDEPLVMFCRFSKDIETCLQVARDAGRKAFELSGKKDELAAWRADTGPSVIVVQIQAGGSGVELQRACKAIYYSVDFSLTNFNQSLARINRPGQTKPVAYFHLVANSTIDEYIYNALQTKSNITQHIVDGLRNAS